MNNKPTRFKKFSFNKKLKTAVICICALLVLLYGGLLFILNNNNNIPCLTNNTLLYQILLMVKDILVVAISIIFTTFLTTWFVDVDSKNNLYKDIVCNDFFASEEFYSSLSESNRREMLSNLEKNEYYKNNQTRENMYKSIVKKLEQINEEIYYNDYKYSVDCQIKNNLITKTIKRTFKLRSLSETAFLNEFRLIYLTYAKSVNINALVLSELKINGNKIDLSDTTKIKSSVIETTEQSKSCGYNTTEEYYYIGGLNLSSDKDTEIELNYTTTVPYEDNAFTCRVAYPCKKFSLEFTLDGQTMNDYTLASYSFGFIDDATSTVHSGSRNHVKVEFNNWIFKSDGAVVVISKK